MADYGGLAGFAARQVFNRVVDDAKASLAVHLGNRRDERRFNTAFDKLVTESVKNGDPLKGKAVMHAMRDDTTCIVHVGTPTKQELECYFVITKDKNMRLMVIEQFVGVKKQFNYNVVYGLLDQIAKRYAPDIVVPSHLKNAVVAPIVESPDAVSATAAPATATAAAPEPAAAEAK